ncbi:MAG: Eco57I restriction-modification methylase domain-containing protein [Candidatus Helarchaeota archaeon]
MDELKYILSFYKSLNLLKKYLCRKITGLNQENTERFIDILLFRIIIVWFLQERGFFKNTSYLIEKFRDLNNKGINYFDTFLKYLIFAFPMPNNLEISNKDREFIIAVNFLINKIFYIPEMEQKFHNIEIKNDAFWIENDEIILKKRDTPIFNLFCRYKWVINEQTKKKFKITPDILGTIYEKSLKKELGTIYTPKRITKYISKRTIYLFLLDKINDKFNTRLSDLNEIFDIDDKNILNFFLKTINDLKLLDPACGSGHFILESIYIIEQIYYKLRSKQVLKLNNYQIKKNIILNNIFGVDLSQNAIEITNTRIFLNLISSFSNIEDIFKLPNIECNIKVGNSVLGFSRLSDIKNNFNNYNSFVKKIEEINYFKNKLKNITTYNLDDYYKIKEKTKHLSKIITKELDLLFVDQLQKNIKDIRLEQKKSISYPNIQKLCPFHWFLEFDIIYHGNGFDIIIGNPPYIRQEKIHYKLLLKHLYKTYSGTADLFVYFLERSIQILKSGGYLGFIVSNKFIKTNYGVKIRKFILDHCKIKEYIDEFDYKIFKNVSIDTCILILLKNKNNLENQILVNNKFYINQSTLNEKNWVFIDELTLKIKKAIERNSILLKNYVGEPLSGIKTGLNEVLVVNHEKINQIIKNNVKEKEIFVKIIKGKDINKWCYNFQSEFLIFADKININDYPNVKRYLEKYKQELINRTDIIGTNKKWYELRPCKYYDKLKKPKIIYPDISKNCKFAYDEMGVLISNTAYAIPVQDKSLLAILNSSLIEFFFKLISVKLGNTYRFIQMYVNQIPIRPPNKIQKRVLEILSDYLIFLYKLNDSKERKKLIKFFEDNLLNCVIYELYLSRELEEMGVFTNLTKNISYNLSEIEKFNNKSDKIEVIRNAYQKIFSNQGIQIDISNIKNNIWIKAIENY